MKRLKWKLGSVCLEIVLILMRNRCTVCMEHTICLEINLYAPVLDDVCHMESRFGVLRDSISFGRRYVHGLRLNAPKSKKPFWKHLLVLLCEEAQVEALFGLFRDNANVGAR